MKNHLTLLIGAMAVFFAAVSLDAARIGEAAPDFSLPDSYGNIHSLSDYAGQYVILEWLNHDCLFVVKFYDAGEMQRLQQKYRDEGAVWFSIISSRPGTQGYCTPDEANELKQAKNAVPTAVLLDPAGDVGRAYGALVTPHMYIITPEGKLVYNGAIDSIRSANQEDIARAENYVISAMSELTAGEPVSTPVSRPYGCTVKY